MPAEVVGALIAIGGVLLGSVVTAVVTVQVEKNRQKAESTRQEQALAAERQREERQTIRQLRRERMQPALDFMETAKKFASDLPIDKEVDRAVDKVREGWRQEDRPPAKVWEDLKGELMAPRPDVLELMRAFARAVLATASAPGLQAALMMVYVAGPTAGNPEVRPEFQRALQSAEQLLEQYLAGAEPQAT